MASDVKAQAVVCAVHRAPASSRGVLRLYLAFPKKRDDVVATIQWEWRRDLSRRSRRDTIFLGRMANDPATVDTLVAEIFRDSLFGDFPHVG